MDINKLDLLQFAINSGIINLEDTYKQIESMNKQEALSKHNYSIWQGKNGKYYTSLPDSTNKKGVRQIMRNTKEKLDDAIAEFYIETEYNPTIKEVYHDWTTYKIQHNEISKGTLDRYDGDFKRYFHINNFDRRRIRSVCEDDIENFVRQVILECNLTHKAFSNCRTLIYGIFKYSKKQKYTNISITYFFQDLDLSENIFKKNIVKKSEQVFNEDEIIMVLNYLNSHPTPLNLGILLTCYTGIRAGELSTLMNTDIDFNQRTAFIQRTEIKYKNEFGKTIRTIKEFPKTEAGVREVILSDKAIQVLRILSDTCPGKVFLFEEKHKRLCGQRFTAALYKVCDTLNIKRRSLHKVRKTYLSNLLDANVDESFVTEQAGHSNIETTERYYYYSTKTHATKIKQLNKADRRLDNGLRDENNIIPLKIAK